MYLCTNMKNTVIKEKEAVDLIGSKGNEENEMGWMGERKEVNNENILENKMIAAYDNCTAVL